MLRKYFTCIGILFFSTISSTYGQKKDFLTANIDSTISPGEDFFRYANGNWITKNAIPVDQRFWGVSSLVKEDIYNRYRKICEKAAAKNNVQGSLEQKIGDLWKTGMDTVAIEKQGWSYLNPELDRISAIKSVVDLVDVAAEIMHKRNAGVLFFLGPVPDPNTRKGFVGSLWYGGVSMWGNWNKYYFNDDAQSVKMRTALQEYIYKTFRQFGKDSLEAKQIALSVYNLEKRLAAAQQDGDNITKISLADLSHLTPDISWSRYYQKHDFPLPDSFRVGNSKYLSLLNKELLSTALEDWKNYYRFWLIRAYAPYLDRTTYKNFFEFESVSLGQPQPPPRWKRVLEFSISSLKDALLQSFIEEYFDYNTKRRYTNIAEAVRKAMKERIEKLKWVSDSTKIKALEKLAKMKLIIGYPDEATWRDYSDLEVQQDSYVMNFKRVSDFNKNYILRRINNKVRQGSSMSILMDDAGYENNTVGMGAGVLTVPGVLDEELDDAFVYGYSGAFIGHEIAHGFDYPGEGWLKHDSIEFLAKSQALIKQFNEFNPVDTLFVNGKRTMRENISDLTGLLIALDALKKTNVYKENKIIGGLNPFQRFFLGYAYRHLNTYRKETLIHRIMVDHHAPDKERVNGVLMNIPEFYEAFNIKPGDKMYRPENLRVKIW